MRFPTWRSRKWTADWQQRPRGSRVRLRLETLEDLVLPTVVAPVFAEMQANVGITHVAGITTQPAVGVDENGNIDAAFTQTVAGGTAVYVRRFNPDGTLQANNATIPVDVGPAGTVGPAEIAVRKDGSFVVAYLAPTPAAFSSIFVKRYNANGSLITTPTSKIQVVTTAYNLRNQTQPAVALIDATGAFYVSWTDQVGVGNNDIRARGFNADGTPINATDVPIATTASSEFDSSITARPTTAGGATAVVISYTRVGMGATMNIFAQRLNTSLAIQGAEFQVNTTPGAAVSSSVAIDAALNFVVTWTDTTAATDWNIKMRRYSGNGTPATPQEETVDDASGNQGFSRVAKAGDDGRYLITYRDASVPMNTRIVFREFTADGRLQADRRVVTESHTSAQLNPAIGAGHNGNFAIAFDDHYTGSYEPWLRAYKRLPVTFFAVGGSPGRVQVRKASDGSLAYAFSPYGAGANVPVAVAFGDVNGDGFPDLVVGATVGNPHVKVYDGKALANGTFDPTHPDTSLLAAFFAYGLQFNVGANVAVGDVLGNGYGDIITGASAGNPQVKVYSGKDIATGMFNPDGASVLAQWFAYGLQFNVGANVAAGDVNGDGFADVVTGASIGNPHVKVYNGKDIATHTFNPDGGSVLAQWFAYGLQFNIGANVAVADTTQSGIPDVITGAASGNPQVRVYSGQDIAHGSFDASGASLRTEFYAYPLGGTNVGVTVAAADFENNGQADILTGHTQTPHYRLVKGTASGTNPLVVNGIDGTPTDLQGGIYVGA